MANDVVYILKNGCDGYELRYSLRSLANMDHGKVWFVGGQPDGLYPDERMEFEQEGASKVVLRDTDVTGETKPEIAAA